MDDLKKHEINFYSLNNFIGFTFLYPIILYNLGFILLSAIESELCFLMAGDPVYGSITYGSIE